MKTISFLVIFLILKSSIAISKPLVLFMGGGKSELLGKYNHRNAQSLDFEVQYYISDPKSNGPLFDYGLIGLEYLNISGQLSGGNKITINFLSLAGSGCKSFIERLSFCIGFGGSLSSALNFPLGVTQINEDGNTVNKVTPMYLVKLQYDNNKLFYNFKWLYLGIGDLENSNWFTQSYIFSVGYKFN